jgi:hypothetical protein
MKDMGKLLSTGVHYFEDREAHRDPYTSKFVPALTKPESATPTALLYPIPGPVCRPLRVP